MKKTKTAVRMFALMVSFLLNAGFSCAAASAAYQLAFTALPTNSPVGAKLPKMVVQILSQNGTNVPQSGTTISLKMNKGAGLAGATNATSDATGKVTFTNITFTATGTNDVLLAIASSLKSATSSVFTISKGGTAVAFSSSTNLLVYGQSITFTADVSAVAPAAGKPTGAVTFKDGTATLGSSAVNTSGVATFTTNKILATTSVHILTAVYGGDGNFSGSTSSNLLQTVGKLSLTVTGITASNKIYDGKTNATLVLTNAKVAGVLSGDIVNLNSNSAKGVFVSKAVGTGKTVTISGLTISGANAGNYSLTQPTATADIAACNLTITAKGVNKIYDGTTNATVTLSDNRLSGDVFTDSYAGAGFTNKNVGTAILINVIGINIAGADASNYSLTNVTAIATANITKAALAVAGITASNKIYDGKTSATLLLANASLVTVFGNDAVTLNTASTKGAFASKTVGNGKTVTISSLTITGADSGNYLLAQPATSANITARSLAITAKGVNKIYDGMTNAAVTLSDNRVSGDVFMDSYTNAAFISKNAASNIVVKVTGLTVAGTDAGNYVLAATNTTTTASILKSLLLVSADNLSRSYGTTNPPLTSSFTNFVGGESLTNSGVTGNSALATAATVASPVGSYPITISAGTLAATNYSFAFSNGTLTVIPAATVASLVSGLNPAPTNQDVTFTATVNAAGTMPSGMVLFKCNGTNVLNNPAPLVSGQVNLTVLAAALGNGCVPVTAEFSDPSGNFTASTNTISQTVVIPVAPCPFNLSLAGPRVGDGCITATLSGAAGQSYVIQASTDLVNWVSICTNTSNTNGTLILTDSNTALYPSRFYRGVIP